MINRHCMRSLAFGLALAPLVAGAPAAWSQTMQECGTSMGPSCERVPSPPVTAAQIRTDIEQVTVSVTASSALQLQAIGPPQANAPRKGFLRRVWRGGRLVVHLFGASLVQWFNWAVEAAVFILVALLTALLDRRLLSTWRDRGFRAVRAVIAAGIAVYIRLLIDRRTPLIGKSLLLLAVMYAVASDDLVPDPDLPLGRVDDLIAVAAASRGFMWICPDRIVQEHAAHALRARGHVGQPSVSRARRAPSP